MNHSTDSIARYSTAVYAAVVSALQFVLAVAVAGPRYLGKLFWATTGMLSRGVKTARIKVVTGSRTGRAHLPTPISSAFERCGRGLRWIDARLPAPLRRVSSGGVWGARIVLAPSTEYERERRRIGIMVLPFFVLATVGAFVPLGYLVRMSFSANNLFIEGWSTDAWVTLFTESEYGWVAFSTISFAAVTSVVAVVIGIAIAHALKKYELPFQSTIIAILSFPIALPGIVVAFMIIVLFGRQGLITNVVAGLTGGNPIQMAIATATVTGLFLGYLYSLVPRATMVLRGTYAEINADAEEAARALGATPWQTFYHVTLPEIRPGVVAAVILTFRTALAIFGTVLILQGLSVATLQIDTELSIGFNSQVAAAIGVVYFLFIIAFTFLGLRYIETDVVEI